jgi:lysophospholipase L1-like esterase
MGTFTSMGFSNLEDASPVNEETERTLIQSLIGEINDLFSAGLCTSPVIDRFLDDDVFGSDTPSRVPLILLGASHLNRMAEHFDDEKWEVHNLSRPGFRITDSSVAEVTSAVEDLAKSVQLDSSIVLIQLYDNSVFQVGGPGGVRSLPKPDGCGKYHINGTLQVANKAAVKEMTTLLQPLIKALGTAKKAFLSPLTRYWLKPCCDNELHHLNYSAPTYLPALGASVFRLRDSIRDSLYTKRCPNFRVVCSNRLLGIGPDLSDEAAREISLLWGTDPVHPSRDAYDALSRAIERDVLKEDVKYINPPQLHGGNPPKRPRPDLSQSRQGWVTGCSAAVPRRDTYQAAKGSSARGSLTRGSAGRGKGGAWFPRRGHGGWRGRPNK